MELWLAVLLFILSGAGLTVFAAMKNIKKTIRISGALICGAAVLGFGIYILLTIILIRAV